MHRPGIASVQDDQVILNGTTVEEVECYHRATLIQAAQEANQRFQEFEARRRAQVLALQNLPAHQKDPFDRLLIAQANAEEAVLISHDPVFAHYPIQMLW